MKLKFCSSYVGRYARNGRNEQLSFAAGVHEVSEELGAFLLSDAPGLVTVFAVSAPPAHKMVTRRTRGLRRK